jgi:uncharacterized protein (DUF488 family)
MALTIKTMGAHGFDEAAFFQALVDAEADLFVDIRRRRGARGAQYAFANSQRLQARLATLGIRYLYRQDLAPTPSLRSIQAAADRAQGIAKRQREVLDPAFSAAYRTQVLGSFDVQAFVDDLRPGERVLVFFCVELLPEACHRSLVAEHLARQLDVAVEDITP